MWRLRREQLEALRKRRKEKDKQLQMGQETLKRTRDRLLEVKTNREYQSMLKEIETFETKNSRVEDEIISLLEELDVFEKELKTQEADLDAKRRRYEEDKASMAIELNSIGEELDLCARKGEEFRKKIPADTPPEIRTDQKRDARRGCGFGLEGGLRRLSHVHSPSTVQRTAEVQCAHHLSKLQPDHLLGEQKQLMALLKPMQDKREAG